MSNQVSRNEFELYKKVPGNNTSIKQILFQAVPDATDTKITWGLSSPLPNNIVSETSGTFTFLRDAYVRIDAQVNWVTNITGVRQAWARATGWPYDLSRSNLTPIVGYPTTHNVSFIHKFKKDDTFEIYGRQESGGPLNTVFGANDECNMTISELDYEIL